MHDVVDLLEGGLIVSCHIEHDDGIDPYDLLRSYARAAAEGGAVALRVESVDGVNALRGRSSLPIIAFVKGRYEDGSDLITPSLEDIERLFSAGAAIVACDVTRRRRPDGVDGFAFFDEARKSFTKPLWADCSVFREGVHAAEAGADIVATTLSGYTPATASADHGQPDYDLVHELSSSLTIPVVAEGRIWTPEQAARARDAGAHAVVVGSAITRPRIITSMFSSALRRFR